MRRRMFVPLVVALSLAAASSSLAQCISITSAGTALTQNFDALANTGTNLTWTDNSTLAGWYSTRATYNTGTGSSNAGALYSFGAASASDRALGGVGSNTAGNIFWAVCFQNDTGLALDKFDVAYVGEQWRNGGNTAAQPLAFEYQVAAPGVVTDADTPATGWTAVASLEFTSLQNTSTAASLNGNDSLNRTSKTATLTVPLPVGSQIWLRWKDLNDSGNDHGLAVDDFSITPIPPTPALSINDVSAVEGTAGPTAFTFTVSLSTPALAGGVSFDIATAPNTAGSPGDFAALSLTGQVIPEGQSSKTFTINVSGDIDPEASETFFVNVTSVVGTVTVTDSQGIGTIINDDGPNLTVTDVTVTESDDPPVPGQVVTFTVNLSGPAPAGGVSFSFATANGTATPGADYQSASGSFIIQPGDAQATFDVTVLSDDLPELTEQFIFDVTSVANAVVVDGQGTGTITDDDVLSIHDVQGTGNSSPFAGQVVAVRGIVTGVKFNGFFIQEPDASVDADPASSEGVFVFTSSTPPSAAAVGNLVEVLGTVQEFVPSADPNQLPLTEITSPTVQVVSTGNPLPAPVVLTTTFPDPAGPVDQLERLEGMRVTVPSLTVVAPTDGNVTETTATATSTGVFYGVVTGVPRPFREAGVDVLDYVALGLAPPIPQFDTNPERIRVDSDALTTVPPSVALDVRTTAVIENLTGPLDYSFRTYTILPENSATVTPVGGLSPTSVTAPAAREFTVASYNLERFFNDVNDPGIGEPVLNATALDNRLAKASRQIRDHLRTPDIVGIVEVENLATLQELATQINNDAVAASQPDPQYAPSLVEGNDVGGIDVGFLVKTASVVGATPRVTIIGVTQELDGTLFVNPDSSTETLHDRPPLVLEAVVNHPNGSSYPVTVIVNHLRSLNGIDDPGAGSNGWPTAGARVRAKRQKQAEDLATLIQTRLTNDPTENIIVVGDFNAFEVNDGFVDVMNVIQGTPTPDNQTVVPGDGVDFVNPNLVNLFDTPPAPERYSYSFDGNAQTLDHVIVSSTVVSSTLARRAEHPRVNADFPEIERNAYGPTDVTRLSDHDPVVSFYAVAAFATAEIQTSVTVDDNPVPAGDYLTYTYLVSNLGTETAIDVSFGTSIVTGTTFKSFVAPGWTCTAPAVGAGGAFTCTRATLAPGPSTITLNVAVDANAPVNFLISTVATIASESTDPNPNNNQAKIDVTTSTVLIPSMTLTKTTTATTFTAPGDLIPYTMVVRNTGTAVLTGVVVVDPLLPSVTCVPAQPSVLLPNNTMTCSGTYAVTPADLQNGSVTNTATAFATGLGSDTLFGGSEARTTESQLRIDDIAQPEAIAVQVTAQGSVTVFGIAPGVSSTRVAFTTCSLELQQDWQPRYTKLQFDVWNEDEVKFTGAYECSDSWHETDFGPSIDSAQQNFTVGVIGTYGARYRVQAVTSTQCPNARATGVLGVQSMTLGVGQKIIGTTLAGAGKFVGSIRWDPSGAVPEGSVR